jgi:hypothetical protein
MRKDDRGAIAVEAVLAFSLFIALFAGIQTWYSIHKYQLALENEAASLARQEAIKMYWATHLVESRYGDEYFNIAQQFLAELDALVGDGLTREQLYQHLASMLGSLLDELLEPYVSQVPAPLFTDVSIENMLTSSYVKDLILQGTDEQNVIEPFDVYEWYCRPLPSKPREYLEFQYANLRTDGKFRLTGVRMEKMVFPAIFPLNDYKCSRYPYVSVTVEGSYEVVIPFIGTFRKTMTANAAESIWSALGNSMDIE